MSPEELVEGFLAAWSAHDGDAFGPLCAPEVSYEDATTAEPIEGASAIADHAERLWRAIPDARLESTGPNLTDGRYVAAPCKLLGSHRGPLDELPASGRFVIVHGVLMAEVEDGRLTRLRVFFDRYDAAQQLGILPSPGTMGEKALLMLRGFGLRLRGESP
ncbi:MAG: hypothetical protein JWN32_2601 [Solirubrobacterales bacterium]|nr:hypothetical protein [Solirubrobacterales bacterium]